MEPEDIEIVKCSNCKDIIEGQPTRQDDEYYCSVECANSVSGDEEEEGYFEETELEGMNEEDE